MSVCLVTGSGGLVGSSCVEKFHEIGYDVVGFDNNMRRDFFGDDGSTERRISELQNLARYKHVSCDIRDTATIDVLVKKIAKDLSVVVHCAAQPSHDYAATAPLVDFSVNALGTLNMLEAVRKSSPSSVFIHLSTNKVYGDKPNSISLVELDTRYEAESNVFADGFDETLDIDQSTHSLFGVSKASADLLAQEYGRYFGVRTAILRGGCLTGQHHSGVEQHGFLSYMMKCAVSRKPYTIYGYKGKQVRDNIDSTDLAEAIRLIAQRPPEPGAVFNIGGGRFSNCSVLEAIEMCGKITGNEIDVSYSPTNRVGDHIWYISNLAKFRLEYPEWRQFYDVPRILERIYAHETA